MKKIFCQSLLAWLTVAMGLTSQIVAEKENQSFKDSVENRVQSDSQVPQVDLINLQEMLPLDGLVAIECSIEPIAPDSPRARRHRIKENSVIEESTDVKYATSTNWGGYVAVSNINNPTPNSVNAITGLWAVPTIAPSAHNTYSAAWIGIDGYSSNSVEQIGTGHDWFNGAPDYYAWFEMYPANSFTIKNFPVFPSDLIGGAIQYLGNGYFQMILANYTRGAYTTIPVTSTRSLTAQRSSAEWIMEAPSDQNGTTLPLSHFGSIPFAGCQASINGIIAPIASPAWQAVPLTMTSSTNVYKAIPSNLMGNGTGFYVYWQHE